MFLFRFNNVVRLLQEQDIFDIVHLHATILYLILSIVIFINRLIMLMKRQEVRAYIRDFCNKIFVNLYKEYTSLKSRELEELPRFVVMIWQPFMLLRSASLCLFRITLCMQRYDFVSYKTKVS